MVCFIVEFAPVALAYTVVDFRYRQLRRCCSPHLILAPMLILNKVLLEGRYGTLATAGSFFCQ
jgi:hypothetical protein